MHSSIQCLTVVMVGSAVRAAAGRYLLGPSSRDTLQQPQQRTHYCPAVGVLRNSRHWGFSWDCQGSSRVPGAFQTICCSTIDLPGLQGSERQLGVVQGSKTSDPVGCRAFYDARAPAPYGHLSVFSGSLEPLPGNLGLSWNKGLQDTKAVKDFRAVQDIPSESIAMWQLIGRPNSCPEAKKTEYYAFLLNK